jgi:epsilon-lactone hydrolase
MLISPWNDLAGTGESLETNVGKDALFTKDWIAQLAAGFLNGQNPRDELHMPMHADLSGFGPLYIQVGDQELLLDDSRMLAARAREAGVEVRLDEFPDQQHSLQMAAGRAPEADDAIDRLAAWAQSQLHVAAREAQSAG